jgi:hypothetical protein
MPMDDTGAGEEASAAAAVARGAGATAVGPGGVSIGSNNYGTVNTGAIVNIHLPAGGPVGKPFQAPRPDKDHIQRSVEVAALKARFLDSNGALRSVTVGLRGIGGAGKTTLARLLCSDPGVRQACKDGILWVPFGKNPPDPRAQIADLLTALTGDASGSATLAGARARLQAALHHRAILLVIDDVWNEAHARDLLESSSDSARLITTRDQSTLPFDAADVPLDVMTEDDAFSLLCAGLGENTLDREHRKHLADLARQLGYWPVLLRLANRALLQRTRQRASLPQALEAVEGALARNGVVAFDTSKTVFDRDQAVAATVEASLESLSKNERQRYLELAIFPEDVPIPLEQAAELWHLTAELDRAEADAFITEKLEQRSLLEYRGDSCTLVLHDVLRRYASTQLSDKALLHRRLCLAWGDRPDPGASYAWRWLAFHRARAALASDPASRHVLAEELVTLVSDVSWQELHERALADLPALQHAIAHGLEAAVADDAPLGVALVVKAADSAVRFRREHSSPTPMFELAQRGDLEGARRRSELFSIEERWRHALLLVAAWLAPASAREAARQLVQDLRPELEDEESLHHLLAWVRADLWNEPRPNHGCQVSPGSVHERVVEQILKRVGGARYERGVLAAAGLDLDASDPLPPSPTRGLYGGHTLGFGAGGRDGTTRYLAEVDGPYLVTWAAVNPDKGREAFQSYISVYTNYNYPEYRYSTLWLLLSHVVRFPRADGGAWVRHVLTGLLASAVGGGSVEFEDGLAVAVRALKARNGDAGERQRLVEHAQALIQDAGPLRLRAGQERSDMWGIYKRWMFATAQGLAWLLGEKGLAHAVLIEALALSDSGFAGYQTSACLAMAEAFEVCFRGEPDTAEAVERALEQAQLAAHNVQDPTFCARMTARVNCVRKFWQGRLQVEQRLKLLKGTSQARECSALHYVGQSYRGRRPDALALPDWVFDDGVLENLSRLYQRSTAGFLRLNDSAGPFAQSAEVLVPDPGLTPHLAARLAAEILSESPAANVTPEQLRSLRSLVPYALASPTALDAVLTRLVLAHGRRGTPLAAGELAAFDAILERRSRARGTNLGIDSFARLPPVHLGELGPYPNA